METKNWKWFKIGEIFPHIYKGTAYNAIELDECSFDSPNAIRYITRTDTTNGCKCYVVNNNFSDIETGNAITIGDTTSTIYYQEKPFICGDHIVILRSPILNKTRGIFIVSLLNKERFRYCYGRAYKKDIIVSTLIKLPIDDQSQPDWPWIERFVKETIIPQLPPKTKSVWQNEFAQTPISNKKLELKVDEWQWFKIGELFEIKPTKGTTTTNMLEGPDMLYIAAKKESNGVNGTFARQGNEDYISQGNCIVFIQIGEGSSGYVTYQPHDFIGMSGKTSCGYNKHLNAYIGEFLVTILDKERQRYSFGRSWTGARLSNTSIKLPAIKNAQGEYEPDWQFMEDYIKSLPYSGCLEQNQDNQEIHSIATEPTQNYSAARKGKSSSFTLIVTYIQPFSSFGSNYRIELTYDFGTDDLQYQMMGRCGNVKLTAVAIASIKNYLRNGNNINDFFNNARSTPDLVMSHVTHHSLTMKQGDRSKTVTNGKEQPWDEFWCKLCRNPKSFTE